MMKNILFVFIFLFITAGSLPAQNGFKPVVSVEDFKKKLSEESANLQSIESRFIQTKHIGMISEELVSKGKFYYKKTGRIILDYSSPISYLIVINDKKIKIVSDGKTNVYDIGSNKMMGQMNRLVSACMTGNLEDLSSGYSLTFNENSLLYWIHVEPQGSVGSYMKSIDIYLDKKTFFVQHLRLTESSSDYTEYEFIDKKKNIDIPDEKFSIK